MGKNKIVTLCLIVGLVLGLVLADGPVSANRVEAAEGGKGTITVSGRGEVVVKPDIAYIDFGLLTLGKTAKEAHEANARQFAVIYKALQELKIPAKDIRTVRFTTYPQIDWSTQKQEVIGYQVEQVVQVAYRDIDHIGTLLDKVMEAGANRVENIQYTTEKWDQYQQEALEKAMDQARVKADLLAKKAGVSVKGIVSITENGVSYPFPSPAYVYFDKAAGEAGGAPAQVHPGEIKIEANVTVIYSY